MILKSESGSLEVSNSSLDRESADEDSWTMQSLQVR